MNYDLFGPKTQLFAVLIALAAGSPAVSRETTRPGPAVAREGGAEVPAQSSVQVRIKAWDPYPRGGEGTFQQRWSTRVARDPADGVASFFTDRRGADGERLDPHNRNPREHLCARPDPAELGARLRVTGPGGSIVCRVADIGPALRLGRAIDMLPAGWRALGFKRVDGLGRVRIERAE